MISSVSSGILFGATPAMMRLKRMFSTPVSSGFRYEISESMAETLPSTCTLPVVGARFPLMIFRSVVFPAPFGPTKPTRSPSCTSNVMFRSAQKTSCRMPPNTASMTASRGRS